MPVHVSNGELRETSWLKEDKAAVERIYHAALDAKMKAGTVCIYLVAPDGKPVATAPLNDSLATDPDRLAELLERVVRDLKVAKASSWRSRVKVETSIDQLIVRIVARYLEPRGDDFVPHDAKAVLGTKKGGDWGALPSQGEVKLAAVDWTKLLPPDKVAVGTEWELDCAVVAKILTHFYPPTENTDLKKNRLDEQSLRGQIESVADGIARGRFEGKLRMKHPFYHKDDANFVDAELVGYIEFKADKSGIGSLRLVTDHGRYGDGKNDQPFGAAAYAGNRPAK